MTRITFRVPIRATIIIALFAGSLIAGNALADDKKDRPGLDLPRGVVSGKLVRTDTGEPLGRQWITLKKRGWSRSASTDTFGRFEFRYVPAGQGYKLSFYHSGYKVRHHGPFAVGQDQTVAGIGWKAVPVDPQVKPYTYSDTYLPGQNITVMVRSIRVPSVDVKVFRVPTKALKAGKTAQIDHKRLEIDPKWRQVLTYRQPVTGGHKLSWRTTKVQPAFDAPGMYVIQVSGAGSVKRIPILVTRLSLITKRTPDAVWVWATDLETGKPFAGVTVEGEVVRKKKKPVGDPPMSLLTASKTRKDGLVRFGGKWKHNTRYWGFQGDHIAYVDTSAASASQALEFRTYVYTDRPAYRPNDKVHFKVLTRRNDGGTYRVVAGEEWKIFVRDPEGQTVHKGTHRTSLFGTFFGDLMLGDSPALGTYTVEARSGKKRHSGRFKVLEYRKPEYKLDILTDKKQVVQGTPIAVTFDARYYFGAPLRGARVTYSVYETPFRPWWYDSYYGAYADEETQGYGEVANSGTVKLDHKGRATIKVDVDRASIDRWVTIEAVVSDSTNREVSARHRVMVTRGTFRVGIRANGKVFKVGEKARFDIEATRFDGKGAKREVTVTASLEGFNTKHKIWIYKTLDTRTLTTDAKGKAVYTFPVKRDGFIRVEVAGTDEYDNPIVQSSFIWATRNSSIAGGYKKKSLDILPDKTRYEPGDTARVLVNTSRNNPWVLFTVEGDGVFEPQVRRMKGNSRLFEVPLSARHAPNVYLSIVFAAGKSFYTLQKSVQVSPAHRMVKIGIKTDKRVYEPGQTASYEFSVTDSAGKPVVAELSVGLVDAAVYAISKELAPNISGFFYGHRPNPVRTAYSFPSRYLGGADKDGEDEDGGGVRRDFKDTAYWKAVVHTGKDGKATVKVPLPDNLTTWRLTVRAITKDTLVGGRTHQIQTSKDLIATVALPRFFRRGDHVWVVGMIHNRGEALKGVKARIVGSGAASVEGADTQTFDLKAASSRAVRWPVNIGEQNKATIAIHVEGGKLRDAEERSVPVYAVAVDRVDGVSGMTSVATTQRFTLPSGTIAGTTSLNVRMAASLGHSIEQSLEDLARFPYGCVEQTMNGFLPDLIAEKALKQLGLKRSGKLASLDAMVRKGLRRLYEMQNSSGGWGWWYDEGHPYMTAYVVYGLARAKELGWAVRDHVFNRGVRSAMGMFRAEEDPNTLSFIVYAIAHTPANKTREAFLAPALKKVREQLDKLNSYSVATLLMAHHRAGLKSEIPRLVTELKKRAIVQGGLAYFPGRAYRYSWTDNAKEATAYAVRALLLTTPGDPLVKQGVQWLMARRRGGMWDTTKDTAAALETLVELMTRSGEMKSSYNAKLVLNGTPIGTLKVTPATVLGAHTELQVPQNLLKIGENRLDVTLDGRGVLYWTGELRYGAPPVPRTAGIEVSREYYKVVRAADKKGKPLTTFEQIGKAGVQVGDEIEVRVTLGLERDYEYLAIEDPLPAGFEVIPGTASGMARREVRDEKIAFFGTRTPQGERKITYRIRAEMSGKVTASPTTAWLMYNPQVGGNGGKTPIVVQPPASTTARR